MCELPTAMFITRPAAAGSTAAARFASTTFSTCVKSREVSPSPKIVGRSAVEHHADELRDDGRVAGSGSWRSPNTLKYRSATVSTPYTRFATMQYCSAASFDTA